MCSSLTRIPSPTSEALSSAGSLLSDGEPFPVRLHQTPPKQMYRLVQIRGSDHYVAGGLLQLTQLVLDHHPAVADHPDPGAERLDLHQQVRGRERSWCRPR